MKAVVTGATGFVGRALVEELLRLNWDVECLCRTTATAARPGVICRQGDLLDPEGLANAVRQSDGASALFHLAAALPTHVPTPDDATYLRANTLASVRLFDAAMEAGIEHVVYASSISVIGAPTCLPITESHPIAPLSSYAISKLAGELHAEAFRRTRGLIVTSLRIPSPYGPGMSAGSVLPRFVQSAMRGDDLTWFGSGKRSQNFIHTRDLATVLVQAAAQRTGGVFNIGGAESISMRALAELVIELIPGTESVARPAGKSDPQEDQRWELDLSRAKEILGYAPSVPLREGLAQYVASVVKKEGIGASGADLGHSR
jgi:Nucleoside-diphosphate-sugar epimerases